jgi:hypothetical protein
VLALYRRLLRLYPAKYVHEYADEMVLVFRQAQQAAREQNAKRRVLFYIRELFGILTGAYRAQWRNFHWTPFRRFEMRSEFRFSRVTVAVMTALLAFVVLTIDYVRDIAANAGSQPTIGILHIPSLSRVLFFLVYGLFTMCIYGSIGYGVILALRKAGLRK